MSKIFNYYKDDVDRTWYQSSNVKYSECVDKENELKTLYVVFNNGTKYKYSNVDVNQYLLFREDASQGKALNKYIKGNNYPYEKMEDADMTALEDELNFRIEGGYTIVNDDEKGFSIEDEKGMTICQNESKLEDAAVNSIKTLLSHFGHVSRLEQKSALC